ncbi:Acyl-CoA-binding domain-containing protein 5, partial [Thoreauomyces humboldtii]
VGNKVYLLGGFNVLDAFEKVWVFDTETKSWTQRKTTGDVPPPRSAHTASASDTTITVFGGFAKDPKPHVYDDVHVLDTETFTWHKADVAALPPGPPAGCLDHDACAVVGAIGTEVEESTRDDQEGADTKRSILVFGGMDLSGMYNSLHTLGS